MRFYRLLSYLPALLLSLTLGTITPVFADSGHSKKSDKYNQYSSRYNDTQRFFSSDWRSGYLFASNDKHDKKSKDTSKYGTSKSDKAKSKSESKKNKYSEEHQDHWGNDDDDDHGDCHNDRDHGHGHGHSKHHHHGSHGSVDKVLICHIANDGGVVINVSENSIPAHESHGDRLIDESEGLVSGDTCAIDIVEVCDTYWEDIDGDGLVSPVNEVEVCGEVGPEFYIPGSTDIDLCPGFAGPANKSGCPQE